jgi:hypothetical protein
MASRAAVATAASCRFGGSAMGFVFDAPDLNTSLPPVIAQRHRAVVQFVLEPKYWFRLTL